MIFELLNGRLDLLVAIYDVDQVGVEHVELLQAGVHLQLELLELLQLELVRLQAANHFDQRLLVFDEYRVDFGVRHLDVASVRTAIALGVHLAVRNVDVVLLAHLVHQYVGEIVVDELLTFVAASVSVGTQIRVELLFLHRAELVTGNIGQILQRRLHLGVAQQSCAQNLVLFAQLNGQFLAFGDLFGNLA